MTPLSMIFKRHREIYENKKFGDMRKRTENVIALRNVMGVAAGQIDPFLDVREFAEVNNVNMQVAAMALAHPLPTLDKPELARNISKCIEILGKEYIHHHEDVLKTLQEYPGVFNEKILTLSGKEMLHYSHNACVDYINLRQLMLGVGKNIDLKYWNIGGVKTDIESNCKANGITLKLVLAALLSEITGDEYPEHLKGLLEVSYLSNIFNKHDSLTDLLIHYELVMKRHRMKSIRAKAPIVILKTLAEMKLLDNTGDWADNSLLGGRLKYLLWILRFRQWYADETVVTTEDNLRIVVNHHELVSHALHNLQMLPESFNYKQHPKDVLKEVLAFVVQVKSKEMRDKLRNSPKYTLPGTIAEKLPSHWHFINNEYAQIMEGQHMNHCCGGRNYLDARSSGKSIFFHVDTDEPHGLTVELRKVEGHGQHGRHLFGGLLPSEDITPDNDREIALLKISLESSMRSPISNQNLYAGSGVKYNIYRLGQVKGRRNRNPTAEEFKEVRAGLLRISDLNAIGEYVGSRHSIAVIDADNIEVIEPNLSLHSSNIGESLYNAAKKGYAIVGTHELQQTLENLALKRMQNTPVIIDMFPEFDITLTGIDETREIRDNYARLRGDNRPDYSLEAEAARLRNVTERLVDPFSITLNHDAEDRLGTFINTRISKNRHNDVYSSIRETIVFNFDYVRGMFKNMNVSILQHFGSSRMAEVANIAKRRNMGNWETNHVNPNVFANVLSLANTNYIMVKPDTEETTC